MVWESVIGLEIHCQLATKSKLFSGAPSSYGAETNVQACAVDLGLPGVLPVPNQQAIEMAVIFGLAINAEIKNHSLFARKNYFYPDLPKGYQISQYEAPIVSNGKVDITLQDGTHKTIGITRAHLEEDAGKSIHEGFQDCTAIDLNRAGVPLIEIVSEPDLRNADEAVTYMKKIHNLVRYLNISDGNMQEGSLRCDVNVSVRQRGEDKLTTRTELKNINSFRFVVQAINHEVARHISILEVGGTIVQETRLYDPNKNETRPMRQKEEANDYRYFPDPDLLPITLTPNMIKKIGDQLSELPESKQQRFMEQYGLSEQDSKILSTQKELADYFEACVKESGNYPKASANWVIGELLPALRKAKKSITQSPVNADTLGTIVNLIQQNTISNTAAKKVFKEVWNGNNDVHQIIQEQGLEQTQNIGELETAIDEVVNDHPKQVKQYQDNSAEKQKKMLGFFVGQVIKRSDVSADPKQINELLIKKLEELSL